MLFSRIVSVYALGAVAALAAPRPDDSSSSRVPHIVGGTPASTSIFNFVGRVLARDPTYKGKTCTATLIAPSVVIATAECLTTDGLTPFNKNLVTVSFGSALQNVYTASQVLVPDKFNHVTYQYNLGLIVLSNTVPSSVATPAKIYTGKLADNTPVLVAGYGLTASNLTAVAKQLMQVDLTLGSQSFCASNNSRFDASAQVCTDGGSGKDTCDGDAGGPLVTANSSGGYALIGINSLSMAPKNSPDLYCGLPGSVEYYERVDYWVDWINKSGNTTFSGSYFSDPSSNSPSTNSSSQADGTSTSTAPTATDTPGNSPTPNHSSPAPGTATPTTAASTRKPSGCAPGSSTSYSAVLTPLIALLYMHLV
ncbi:trypsin-like serine protease [Martensiomyces pterosporus]|nr:trypsin-like serine protease [Martensiomyces pterosporus]